MSALVKVGSFAKSTAGTGSQAVTGVGFIPKLLFFFTSGGVTSNTFRTGLRGSMGASSGASESYAISFGSDDSAGTSNTARRMSAKLLCQINGSGTVLAECDLTSFDADGFTVDWTTNDANATIINYIAYGGAALVNAKVFNWQKRNGTGIQTISGVGFQPDAFLNLHMGNISTAVPNSQNNAIFGFGAGTGSGSFEWAMCNNLIDAAATSDTQRVFLTDAVITTTTNGLVIDNKGSIDSFSSDGLDINWTAGTSTLAQMIGICVKGGQWAALTRNKPTGAAPASDAASSFGFSGSDVPVGVLAATVSNTNSASAATHGRMGVGATDGTSSRSFAFSDTDNLGTTAVDAIDTTYFLTKVNNSTPAIDARASFSAFGSDSFTSQWDVNDAVATRYGLLIWAPGFVETTTDVVADGIVQATQASEVVADGIVQVTQTTDVVADAIVVDASTSTLTTDVIADGIVSAVTTSDVVASGLVQQTVTTDLTIDALLIAPATTQSLDLTTSGIVRARGLNTDVVADGYVSTGALGGRLVAIADGSWHTPGTWVYADAEETSGTQLLHPRYTRELRFTPEADYATGGFLIPVACDAAHDPGGTLTIELGEVIADVLTPITQTTLPETGRVESAGVEYFHVRWDSPQSLTTGNEYYVRVLAPADNVAPMVVVSVRTIAGLSSYVLNGIVVSTTAVTTIEPRSVVVAPLVVAGVRGTRSVSFAQSDATNYRTVYLAPGSTLTFSPGVTTRLGVDKVLHIGAGATLSLAPTGSATATVAMTAADAGILVNGEVSCAGSPKDRIATLDVATGIGDLTLTLVGAPSGWLPDDRLLVQTNSTSVSRVVTVDSVAGAVVTLTTTIGGVYAAGTRIVNLTRAVQIMGYGLTTLSTLRINAGAEVSLTNVELRYLGPATAVAPNDLATVTLNDVVIAEGAILVSSSGPTALIPGALTTCEDITIYKYKTGLVLASGRTHTGTVIVADTNVAHTAIIVQGSATFDAIGIGINGALVNVWAGGAFTGSLENHYGFGPGASLLCCVSGAVETITLTESSYSGVSTNGAAIYIGPAGSLGYGLITGLTTDRPVLLIDSGANYAGRLILRECVLDDEQVLVKLVSRSFVDLVDEDGFKPEGTALVDGTLITGSRVANRTRTDEVAGYRERSTAEFYSGATSMHISGTAHTVELGRYRVSAGEVIRLGAFYKGSATLRLRSSLVLAAAVTEAISSVGWDFAEITATAIADGILVFEATVTGDVYLDQLRRT